MLKNAGRLFASKMLSQALTLGSVIYFSRVLTPTELGTYFYFISVLSAIGILADLGVSGASEKFASEDQNYAKWHSTALCCILGFSAIFLSGIVISSHFGFNLIPPDYLVFFGVALLADRVSGQYEHMLRAEFQAGLSGLVKLGRSLGFVVLAILFLKFEYSAALILGATLARVLVVPLSMTLASTSLRLPSVDAARELIRFGFYFSINVIGNKTFIFADVILIGIILSAADVARYEVAWKLFFGLISLNTAFALTAFSYISSAEDAATEIEDTLKSALLIPLPAALGSAIVGPSLVTYLFTESYSVPRSMMAVLGAALIFQSLYFVFSRAVIALGGERKAFFTTFTAAFSNIVLNLVLIPRLGILGGAIATTGSFAIATVSFYFMMTRIVTVELPYREIGIQIVATIVMGVVLLQIGVTRPTPTDVVLLIVSGVASYLFVLLLRPSSRRQLRQFL